MKKMFLTLSLSWLLASGAFAANGHMYLANVNDVFGSEAKLQFKVVAKTSDGKEVKSVETDNITTKKFVNYTLADFGLKEGNLDIYVKDVDQGSGYDKCLDGFPYADGIMVVIHAWSVGKGATCELAEDAKESGK